MVKLVTRDGDTCDGVEASGSVPDIETLPLKKVGGTNDSLQNYKY